MKSAMLLITFIVITQFAAGVQKEELSLSAQNSIKKMERAIETAKKTAVSELTDLMKKEMKSGKLESAMVLDKIIKSIDTETPSILNAGGETKSEYIDDITGAWEMEGGRGMEGGRARIVFNQDGTCTVHTMRITEGLSTWVIESKKLIVTNKKLNTTETFELPPKTINIRGRKATVLEGKSSAGEKITLFRRNAD